MTILTYFKNLILLTFLFVRLGFSQQVKIEYETIQLSHIESDRAAGVLKALGYTVVEFDASKGSNPRELILEPDGKYIHQGSRADTKNLPIIIVMPETENITLLEMQSEASKAGTEMSVDMGGSSLIFNTTSEPLQRFMIAYDPTKMDAYYTLFNIIRNKIDVPAKQVVIDALVLEIDSEKISELGIHYSASASPYSMTNALPSEPKGTFTMVLDKALMGKSFDFHSKLQALVSSQQATILSRPSVIVLDGRQARIVVGQQIPINETSVSANFATTKINYIPIGIVLNLRPKISSDNRIISMQIETIISETETNINSQLINGILLAPTINSRKVQTYVNIPNDTPFIIGGLISSKKNIQRSEIPILSAIPFLGKLFKFTVDTRKEKEVIVLITPNVVEVDKANFTKMIPKDSDQFQQFGTKLFQNTYRIQHRDVYDLDFAYETNLYQKTLEKAKKIINENPALRTNEKISMLVEGKIPGQKVLIRRMLARLIERFDFYQYLNNEQIFFFEKEANFIEVQSFQESYTEYLMDERDNAYTLIFKQSAGDLAGENTLNRPIAIKKLLQIPENYKESMASLNTSSGSQSAIIIYLDKHERRLYETLILEKVIELNPDILSNISNFAPGLQIIFPSQEVVESEIYILDKKTAQLFYEINNYNNVFDARFIQGIQEINKNIESLGY